MVYKVQTYGLALVNTTFPPPYLLTTYYLLLIIYYLILLELSYLEKFENFSKIPENLTFPS